MRRFRKIALASAVWATAAMTLAARTPHFVCRCADGSVKLFCLGVGSQVAGTCCRGGPVRTACCGNSSSAAGAKSKCCCCHKATRSSTKVPTPGLQVREHGCSRTLAQAAVLYVSVEPPGVASHLIPGLLLAAAPLPFSMFVPVEGDLGAWHFDRRPPPTDRVITLQRL